MNPRLPNSKKWTDFPKDYISQIEQVFKEGFSNHLNPNQSFLIEGRIYPGEIIMRVGLKEAGKLRNANFEVSTAYSNNEHDAMTRIHDCVDAIASMVQEYIENEGVVDFPRKWTEFEFNKRPVFLQFTTVNSELESEADRILREAAGEDSKALVYGDDEEDGDAMDRVDEEIDPEMVKKLRH